MNDQAKKQAYKHLSAPLPIQIREPVPTASLIQFVEEDASDHKRIWGSNEIQQLSSITSMVGNKKNIHQIGDSLTYLFNCPLYKCHQYLQVNNNQQFCSYKTDQNYKLPQPKKLFKHAESALIFESRFESGNLALASYANTNRQFYLALQRDANSTSKTTQWFYFKVNNKTTGIFTFHIVNYIKPFSMFKVGMKPCVLSKKKDIGWERGGFDIQYRKNSIVYNQNLNYYTLSFSYNFTELDDQVYFSYSYPYTYTRLQRFLDSIERKYSDRMRRKLITKTLGGNLVQMVSITNPQYLNKRLMFITARVHPGQTNSSFCCQSIISFLLSNNIQAQKLRDQFIIKIVPMLNPDGVVNGNYRCSLSGEDLNRQWKAPSKILHPQIFNMKKIILQSEYKKSFYMDIHGHSKKKASFMYGCVSSRTPYLTKQLPYVLSKKMNHFNYYSCNFTIQKSKEGTSRITLWRAGIDHSYTYEISFCGPQRQKRHFNPRDYETMGIQLCKNLSGYFHNRILNLQIDEELNKHCQQFYNNEQLLCIGNQQTDGSSSQLQDQKPAVEIIEVVEKQKICKPKIVRKLPKQPFITEKTQVQKTFVVEEPPKQQINLNMSKEFIQQYRKSLDKTLYFKNRQSFVATKINIQQMNRFDFNNPNLSTFYGFTAEKSSNTHLQQIRSISLRTNNQNPQSQVRQKSGDSFGILLPNVQKNQYKRYERSERYKVNKGLRSDRSASVYVQNLIQSTSSVNNRVMNSSGYFSRLQKQISLIDKIRSKAMDKAC